MRSAASVRPRSHVRPAIAVVLVSTALLLSSCAAGANPAEGTGDPAGFWLGLWHGIILPVTFVISLFSDTVGIYEVVNNGNWYNFGFVLGAGMFLGGGGGAGMRARRRR